MVTHILVGDRTGGTGGTDGDTHHISTTGASTRGITTEASASLVLLRITFPVSPETTVDDESHW